jgi:protein-L-isoaspartate O-methyltransferase
MAAILGAVCEITDPAVLAAMWTVPHAAFVRPDLVELAYDDLPLPLGAGQTICQSYCRFPEHVPYDGIVVAAGGQTISTALQEQLALGGRCENPAQ